MSLSKPQRVADALNELKDFNMMGSADPGGLMSTLTDYFVDNNLSSESEDGDMSSDSEFEVSLCQHFSSSTSVLDGDKESLAREEETDDDSEDFPIVNDGQSCREEIQMEISKTNVPEDESEELHVIRKFNCKCQAFMEGQCLKQFEDTWIMDFRRNMQELTQNEKDLIIMAKVSCTISLSEALVKTRDKHKHKRTRQCTKYLIEGKSVCRDAFKFLHLISQNKLTACIAWYKDNGLCPRRKKSGGRVTGRALSFEDIERIVDFLKNFAEKHALVLPGRVPGFNRTDLKLLPSTETKASIWRKYVQSTKDLGCRAAKLTSFKAIWQRLVPHIMRTKPMSDLCFECQKNNHSIYRAANLPEVVKSAKLKKQERHLKLVEQERDIYRTMVKDTKNKVKELGLSKLEKTDPNSKPFEMHYSFDFAQQVHFPHNPYQPGPIFFLTPRKCAIFGVCCEALPQQVNYLIDEGMANSKGSNAVISYLHHFFSNFGLGERTCHLHCDNCSGQNKNKFVIWYFLWRTLNGLHTEVTLNFLIAGHTKFAPDWCFGLLKQKYRRTEVNTLKELADVVRNSTPQTGVNQPQLVGDEKGSVFVDTFNWQEFLSPFFRPLKGIKEIHRMRFSSKSPGVVYIRETSDAEERPVQMLKDRDVHPPKELPVPLQSPGLDMQRQEYLFNKIRDFCLTEEAKDLVCPRPRVLSLMEEEELPSAKRRHV